MRQICSEDYSQTKVVWTKGYTWDGLHQIETWVKPMTEPLLGDLLIISIFTAISITGLFLKSELVHSGYMLHLFCRFSCD